MFGATSENCSHQSKWILLQTMRMLMPKIILWAPPAMLWMETIQEDDADASIQSQTITGNKISQLIDINEAEWMWNMETVPHKRTKGWFEQEEFVQESISFWSSLRTLGLLIENYLKRHHKSWVNKEEGHVQDCICFKWKQRIEWMKIRNEWELCNIHHRLHRDSLD